MAMAKRVMRLMGLGIRLITEDAPAALQISRAHNARHGATLQDSRFSSFVLTRISLVEFGVAGDNGRFPLGPSVMSGLLHPADKKRAARLYPAAPEIQQNIEIALTVPELAVVLRNSSEASSFDEACL